jgi:cell division protease FtsH
MAREMVTRYGMSDALGTQVYGEAQHEVFLGRDYANHQDLSAETTKRIDDEVERIMREAHGRARRILEAHADRMHKMAEVLLAEETVEGDEMDALLNGTYDEWLAEHAGDAKAAEPVDEAPASESDGGAGTSGGRHAQRPVPVEEPATVPVPMPEPPMAGTSTK